MKASLGSASIPAAPLPFAAVPNVRVGDGNVHRVLRAALREQLRILLVETSLAESAALLPRRHRGTFGRGYLHGLRYHGIFRTPLPRPVAVNASSSSWKAYPPALSSAQRPPGSHVCTSLCGCKPSQNSSNTAPHSAQPHQYPYEA